jgi:hypothetical protein
MLYFEVLVSTAWAFSPGDHPRAFRAADCSEGRMRSIALDLALLCHRLLRNAIFPKGINRLVTFTQKY